MPQKGKIMTKTLTAVALALSLLGAAGAGAASAGPGVKRSSDTKETVVQTNEKKPKVMETETNGTYGDREKEKKRIGIETGSNTHQSEHIVGFAVAHPELSRKDSKSIENAMPAYHETADAHRNHPGTGNSLDFPKAVQTADAEKRNEKRREETGWSSSEDFRTHVRATLADPVAAKEGTTASNAYQLNQLGYATLKAHGLIGAPSAEARTQANDSYDNMVTKDPPLEHTLRAGTPASDRLGPYGQAEAYLARRMQETGRSTVSLEEKREAFRRFGVHPDQ
jgi:hypothetical protein